MDAIYNLLSFDTAHALSWTLLHSIWQGLLIACTLSLLIKHAKLTSKNKSLVSLGALVSLFATSIFTFCYYYDFSTGAADGSTLALQDWEVMATYLAAEQNQTYGTITGYISENSQYIVLAWVLGLVLFTFHLLFGLFQLHTLKQRLVPLSDYWQARLGVLADKINYSGKILMGESSHIQSPITFGFLKPVVLFPVGMVNHLSIQEVEAIMAHELAHIVRKDYLINFLQTLLEGIYYFNPGVWIISSIIRNQREHCCDDIAIELTGNSVHYLKALVAIEESTNENYLAMGFSGNKKPLLQRVQRILNQPQKNSNMKEKLIMTFIFLIGLLIFSFDLNSRDKDTVEAIHETEASTSTLISTTTNDIQSIHKVQLTDTIPSEIDDLKYQEHQNVDTPTFEERVKDGDVKIIMKDGKIEQMEIDGRDLSKEEIDNIQYKLSDDKEETISSDEEYEDEIRREIEENKEEILQEKESIKREIISAKKEAFADKERIKNEIRADKDRIRDIVKQAKAQAREGIKAAKSYRDMDTWGTDTDWDDFGDDLAMDIREAFESVGVEMNELQEERVRIEVDFAEQISKEMEELEEEMLEMQIDLEEEMLEMQEDLEEEMLEIQEDLLDDFDDMDIWSENANYNTEEIIQVIVDELLSDNLIENKNEYSFLLKKNKFQVNGKTLPSSLRKKYEEILEDLTNEEWTSNSKLKLVRTQNSNSTQFHLNK